MVDRALKIDYLCIYELVREVWTCPPAFSLVLCCLAGRAWGGAAGTPQQGPGSKSQRQWQRVKDDPHRHQKNKQQNKEAARRYKAKLKLRTMIIRQQMMMRQRLQMPSFQHPGDCKDETGGKH